MDVCEKQQQRTEKAEIHKCRIKSRCLSGDHQAFSRKCRVIKIKTEIINMQTKGRMS